MVDAYLHDPEVIDMMARNTDTRPGTGKPSLFGWSAELAALKDIQDQMIASRGGKKFVPRPEIPGRTEMWRRKDTALSKVVAKICVE